MLNPFKHNSTIFKKLLLLLIIILISNTLLAIQKIELPEKPDLEEFNLEKITSANLADKVIDFSNWIVADNKIYFCSMLQKELAIIDFDGNLLKILSSQGSGPGEFQMPQSVLEFPDQKRISVFDNMQRKYIFFTYEGEYIEDEMINPNNIVIPHAKEKFGEHILNYIFKMKITEDNIVMSPTIEIEKEDENITLASREVTIKMMRLDPSQFSFIYACNDDYVYLSDFSREDFSIDVFNENGEKVKKITKPFKKIKKSKEDLEKLEAKLEEYSEMSKSMGVNQKFDTSNLEYMESIRTLLCDDENNIWIGTYDENKNFCFLIMSPQGKLLKKWVPENSDSSFNIYEDKLIEVYSDDNDEVNITVYQL